MERTASPHRGTFVVHKGKDCHEVTYWGHSVTVCRPYGSYEVIGPGASHTGYKSLAAFRQVSENDLFKIAAALIEKQVWSPFLIGRHDCPEANWSFFSTTIKPISFRVPKWTEAVLTDALSQCGFKQDCELNSRWIACDETWSEAEFREILNPLLQDETRMLDQADLASRLKHAFAHASVHSKQTASRQISLF